MTETMTTGLEQVMIGGSTFHGSFTQPHTGLGSRPTTTWTVLQREDPVSMIELKELARKMLHGDSTLRMLILSEPDRMPRIIALSKIEIFLRLLHKEQEA